MATPQFNLKTGADTQTYFGREITSMDVTAGEYTSENVGKIKPSQATNGTLYEYPVLVRRTGDSIRGSTETIESNELRKGRTRSAPRLGNSSSEGSLDFEFSPETFDDMMEAALRGKWTEWNGDANSVSNLDKIPYAANHLATKRGLYDKDGKVLADAPANPSVLLMKAGTNETDAAIITVETEDFMNTLEVHELNCGTEDIRYSMLKQFGGVAGEDLYQEFEHLAVNTMSLSVSPGQIVTGSFGFMGTNDPRMLETGTVGDADNPDGTELVKTLKGRFFELTTSGTDTPANRLEWINNLPAKGTSTDQYTAREGFLYINGRRVRYGSNLDFELNNGLEKIFAIFEKDAISVTPLQLDITGNLSTYLTIDREDGRVGTNGLFNMATNNEDIELLFCFQDKEENPEALYVVQVFKAKFTDHDASTSGADTLDVGFPYQSFEERAVRVLRIRKRRPMSMTLDADTNTLTCNLSSIPSTTPTGSDFKVEVTGEGLAEGYNATLSPTWSDNVMTCPLTGLTEGTIYSVSVTYNGQKLTKNYTIPTAG